MKREAVNVDARLRILEIHAKRHTKMNVSNSSPAA